jgi:hypothetical protein
MIEILSILMIVASQFVFFFFKKKKEEEEKDIIGQKRWNKDSKRDNYIILVPIAERNKIRIMIVVHHPYNKCTTPLHMGWAPHTVGSTPCEGVLYICCTLGVHESLPIK